MITNSKKYLLGETDDYNSETGTAFSLKNMYLMQPVMNLYKSNIIPFEITDNSFSILIHTNQFDKLPNDDNDFIFHICEIKNKQMDINVVSRVEVKENDDTCEFPKKHIAKILKMDNNFDLKSMIILFIVGDLEKIIDWLLLNFSLKK